MGSSASIVEFPTFEPSALLLVVTAVFGFLHALTGCLALFLETDLLYYTLLDVDTMKPKPLLKGSWAAFLRGPNKRTGRGKAPNVRAWGARQLTVSVPFWFALYTGELLAFQIAFACLLTRICGDIAQNAIDGCWWKVALFAGFEPVPVLALYALGGL
mmetsp:Transcript_18392/g.54649  ORF Transcript_18392/g.54649 Transcript_18392/m.54649 type:complete len:158 (+) Transcript_18392:216-689(+)|eukprot:CAMPEP_0119267660 /NCGR_PEP_ID=MMETSP1329-20130426/5721_1 /TAXON_ID=114041 /ORGANISM="Genus nov. species nov., Strain RCC1024" /LENGTH=157 /DNA_ID=CAMNT_0007267597 /DNA_START=185 /DNA_END=658 /DNA_ORIENTATION=-